MRMSRPSLFHHRDTALTPGRRTFEGVLVLALLTMTGAVFLGIAAFLWNIGTGGISQSDIVGISRGPMPLTLIILCLAWWFSLSTFLARKRVSREVTSDDHPQAVNFSLLLPLTHPRATFLIVPLWAFLLAQMSSTLTWPTIQLTVLGTEVMEFAQVEKLGARSHYPKRGQRCSTAARLRLSDELYLDHCLTRTLYDSLNPGDGVQLSFLVYGDFLRLKTLSRVPAADLPADLIPDPALAATLMRRAGKDQAGTSAQ